MQAKDRSGRMLGTAKATKRGSTVLHLVLEELITALTSGEEYLKLPSSSGVVLSSLLALPLVAYAAGMLVRYHPGYWAALKGKRNGDAIAPVLSAAVSAVEERYPALILEVVGG